jgi:uncharacterized membrane protein
MPKYFKLFIDYVLKSVNILIHRRSVIFIIIPGPGTGMVFSWVIAGIFHINQLSHDGSLP